MQILDGNAVAQARRHKIQSEVREFHRQTGRTPGLAVILVGDDPASQVYVANKLKACEEVGIRSSAHRLPAHTEPAELKAVVDALNQDPSVDGILLQLPLPKGLKIEEAIEWISPAKDVDCLTSQNLGRLWVGRALTRPCTPWGVMAILDYYGIEVSGLNAVVVGRSHIVGKPMAHLLTEANATVTVCHSKTRDLRAHTAMADLVIVAAGLPEFLGKGDFREESVVIDVGIHRRPPPQKGLCGDVRIGELKGIVRAATPVPGGVGPMTITMLLENTLCLAKSRG